MIEKPMRVCVPFCASVCECGGGWGAWWMIRFPLMRGDNDGGGGYSVVVN